MEEVREYMSDWRALQKAGCNLAVGSSMAILSFCHSVLLGI